MTRAPRPPPTPVATAARRGPGKHAFDELAALRGKLKAPPRDEAAQPAGAPSRSSGRALAAPASPGRQATEDEDLLRASLRDVTPLSKARGRIELAPPKPAPVPRARPPEAPDPDPAPARVRRRALDGPALFRSEMGDVTPLRCDARADSGRPRRVRPAGRAATDAATPTDGTLPLLLPPDADATAPADLFRYAVRGTQPIDRRNRAELSPPAPSPEPLKRCADEQDALRESLAAPLTLEDRLEMGDEAVFLRPGMPRRVLLDLRRGRWVLQAELDLHGYNREEARAALGAFLAASLQRGDRCVRVIHGKGLGSPGKLSILKQLSRGWLAQREEILAFCQAGPHAGGSGALLVLLKGRPAVRDGGA
jgi:DNA-nicking Smr family endonuclease